MSRSEELKERIGYLKGVLNILLGIVALTVGGLANLYLKNQLDEIFWFGYGCVIVILFCCLKVASKIEQHLKELGGL